MESTQGQDIEAVTVETAANSVTSTIDVDDGSHARSSVWHTLRPYAMRIVSTFYIAFFLGINDGGFGVILPSIEAYYNVNDAVVSVLFLSNTVGFLDALRPFLAELVRGGKLRDSSAAFHSG